MKFCTQCGTTLGGGATAAPAKSNTAGLVLGIIATALGALGFAVLGWIEIVALILGIIGLVTSVKAPRSGKRTAGIVLGIIGTVCGAIGLIVYIWAVITLLALL